jgi:hypothetical protein
MTYLEQRYIRGLLLGLAGLGLLDVVIVAIGSAFGRSAATAPSAIPLSSMIALGAFPAAVVATILTGAFCRQNVIIDLMWTRPVSRTRIALGIIGVDLATIYGAWLISFAFGMAALLIRGTGYVVVDEPAPVTAIILAGSLAAIYGVGIAISYTYRSPLSTLTPAGWAISFVALIATFLFLIPIMKQSVPALRLLQGEPARAALSPNVIAPLLGLDAVAGTITTFALAIIGIAATTYGWRRAEF